MTSATSLARLLGNKTNSPLHDSGLARANWLAWYDFPRQALEEIFGPLRVCKLLGIAQELEIDSWKGLSTEWEDPQRAGVNFKLRLDRNLILTLLQGSLGVKEDDSEFHCRDLSDLESNIFEALLVSIIEKLSGLRASAAAGSVELIWYISLGSGWGKLALSLPTSLFPALEEQINEEAILDYADLMNTKVAILLGSSELSMKEIASLESGDFILLQESSSDRGQILGTESLDISFDASESKGIVELNNFDMDDFDDNDDFGQNLDDEENIPPATPVVASAHRPEGDASRLMDFPVEVRAEFAEVSLTVKELLSLQEGMALPLNDLLTGQLFLTAKGKRIASGELILVGDKFGILIKHVLLQG